MLLPMLVMKFGIFKEYWGDFLDNAWSVHIHYCTGTMWYIYLIIQPYFATHGQMGRHRTNGIVDDCGLKQIFGPAKQYTF